MKGHAATNKPIAGAVAVILSGLILTGCTTSEIAPATTKEQAMTPEKTHTMTPEETKAFATRLYKATTDTTGGTWTVDADTWNECAPGHVHYSLGGGIYDYKQPDPDELDTLTKKVQQAWADLGIHGKRTIDTNLEPVAHIVDYPGYLEGTDEDRAGYTFYAQSNRLLIILYAPCVPGDLDDVDPIE